MADRGPATLMGPWRYSMAGYDSAHAPLASRILSAASFARPTVHPRPRNTKWSNAAGRAAVPRRSLARRRRAIGSRSSPRPARSSASAPVANRVWTTERSSAKPRMIRSSAASATGVSSTPQIATERAPCHGRSEQPCHLGRRAAPRDRHHHVVCYVRGRLRGGERVGLALARQSLGARRRPASHEQRGAAADRRDPVAGSGEDRRRRRSPRPRTVATCRAGSSARARFRSFERTLFHERSSAARQAGAFAPYTPADAPGRSIQRDPRGSLRWRVGERHRSLPATRCLRRHDPPRSRAARREPSA